MTLLWNSSISTRTNDRIATVLSLPFINNPSLHPSTDMGGMNEHEHKTQKRSEIQPLLPLFALIAFGPFDFGDVEGGLIEEKDEESDDSDEHDG